MVPNPLAGDPGLSAASPLSSGCGQGCGGLGCGRRERGVHGRPGSPALVGARQRPRRPQRRQDCGRGSPGNSNPRHPGAGEDPAAPATLARPVMRAWRLRPPRSWRPGAGVRPTPTTSPPRAYSPARPVRRRLSLRPLPCLPLALFVPPHRATSKVSILAGRGRRRAPWRLVSPPQLMARGRGDHTLRIQYSTAEC